MIICKYVHLLQTYHLHALVSGKCEIHIVKCYSGALGIINILNSVAIPIVYCVGHAPVNNGPTMR